MTALILLAHGSRHPDAAGCLRELADAVSTCFQATHPGTAAGRRGPSSVEVAWLDLASPSLDSVLERLAAAGERDAVVVPMLFTDAFHARVDVPAQVREVSRHGVDLHVTAGLGRGEGTQRAMLRSLARLRPASGAPACARDLVVMAVGSSDAAANDAVRDFAGRLSRCVPGRVSAAFAVAVDEPRGADAVAAAARSAASRGRDLAVLPLFTAPGLLWDLVTGAGGGSAGGDYPCDVAFAEPLGALLADVVRARWDSAPHAGRLGCPSRSGCPVPVAA